MEKIWPSFVFSFVLVFSSLSFSFFLFYLFVMMCSMNVRNKILEDKRKKCRRTSTLCFLLLFVFVLIFLLWLSLFFPYVLSHFFKSLCKGSSPFSFRFLVSNIIVSWTIYIYIYLVLDLMLLIVNCCFFFIPCSYFGCPSHNRDGRPCSYTIQLTFLTVIE